MRRFRLELYRYVGIRRNGPTVRGCGDSYAGRFFTIFAATAVLPDGLRFVKCVGRTARIVYHGLAPVEDAAPYAVDLSRIQAPLPTTAAESGSEDGPASLATTVPDDGESE